MSCGGTCVSFDSLPDVPLSSLWFVLKGGFRGIFVFLTSLMPIDALSLVVCTMMGLALGVDYSLLIVSRFREELPGGQVHAWQGDETES